VKHTPALARLIESLRVLPGVGPKSAQRMAFHLLQDGRAGAAALVDSLSQALSRVGRCARCRMLTEGELCAICASPQRDAALVCVVESPADVVAIEQSGGYRGRYFVLMGHLSPLDGVGPEQLGVPLLEALLDGGGVQELILATNPTVEGEATAHFLSEMARARSSTSTAARSRTRSPVGTRSPRQASGRRVARCRDPGHVPR
jgi:recombination protein RecR